MRNAIIANLRYADAPRAIEFLCNAFGFERRAVYLDEVDPKIVQHAQLTWCDRMIMISTAHDNEFTKAARMKTVAQAGGTTMRPLPGGGRRRCPCQAGARRRGRCVS